VKASIRVYNQKNDIECLTIPDIADIWIRDWGPIPAVDSTGRTVAIKATYEPRYLLTSKAYQAKADADDTAGRKLAEFLGLPLIDIPLIWDIGNLTHNGEGTAIVTERLIEDNKDRFTEVQIRTRIKETLNIDRLIILPEEPGDETGHVDGMVRFINSETVVVGAYTSEWAKGKRFMNKIAEILKQELGTGYKIVRIPNGTPPNEKSEGMYSAVGNHINFLRLGKKLLLPMYGIQADEKAIESFRKNLPSDDIIPVNIPGTSMLASKGGILNCITWNYF